MTTDQAINAIRAIQLNALRAAGNVGLAQVIPFVPIDTGDLRASGTVKDDGKDVYIVFGGKDSPGRPGKSHPSEYVENQYSTAERHYDTGGGVLGRITDVGENFVQLEVAEGVQVRIQKQAVGSLMPKGTCKGSL
jgi:hypothetical protein